MKLWEWRLLLLHKKLFQVQTWTADWHLVFNILILDDCKTDLYCVLKLINLDATPFIALVQQVLIPNFWFNYMSGVGVCFLNTISFFNSYCTTVTCMETDEK